MTLAEIRAELETDLSWRVEELRSLRNQLLGDFTTSDDWPVASLRALLVMQYAHVEGFTQTALGIYVNAINGAAVPTKDLRVELHAAALASEFKALRTGVPEDLNDTERLVRRAKRHVDFVQRVRLMESESIELVAEDAVSLEMNLGSEVLKKNLFILGIPSSSFSETTYKTLEFIRRNRNDIAHGGRRDRIPPNLFESHWEKCEEYMNELARLLTRAIRDEWYRAATEIS